LVRKHRVQRSEEFPLAFIEELARILQQTVKFRNVRIPGASALPQ